MLQIFFLRKLIVRLHFHFFYFQEFLNWKWYVGGMLTLFVALFGLVANSMSMVVLFRPKIRAVAFNQLLFVLCGVDSFFLFCNSMSIGHALGLNNSKCDLQLWICSVGRPH